MQNELEARPAHHPVVRKAFAGLVLIIAGALALKFVIGFVIWIFGIVVVIAAVVAIAWALKTLLR